MEVVDRDLSLFLCKMEMVQGLEYKVYCVAMKPKQYGIHAIINKAKAPVISNIHTLPATFPTKEEAQEFLEDLHAMEDIEKVGG